MGISALLSNPVSYLKSLLIMIPAILPALVLHEYAHAWVANKLGDPTAAMLGRLTLDPRKHLDPLGLLSMFLIGLGWARPVPINPRYYKHPRRDDFLVSIAGITMNLIQFVVGCVLIVILTVLGKHFTLSGNVWYYVFKILQQYALTNIGLAVFNLLPIPPLDGYHVLNDLILKKSLFASQQVANAGRIILLALIWTGLLDKPFNTIVYGAYYGIMRLCQALHII